MLLILGLLLFVTLAFLILLLPALAGREIYHRYSGARAVICPENQQPVAVAIDARHAAATGISHHPDLRLADCSRWPQRWKCDRACLPSALQAQPFQQGEVQIASKRIYHLPVLLAAFVAWYLGALWHSHYLFRTRWMEAVGLTPAQLKEVVHWYSPHLLSAAACILFAYGVAWLMALRGRTGVLQGLFSSLLLWGALVLATRPAAGDISRNLLLLETGYTFLAAVAVGFIIGSLTGKLVLSSDFKPAA